MGPRLLALAAIALLVAAPERALAADQLAPIQADLSVVSSFGPEPTDTIAVFAGWVHPTGKRIWGLPFQAVGLEITAGADTAAYKMSVGAQWRAGYVWGPAPGGKLLFPDLILFARVTPFAGGSGGIGGEASDGKIYGMPAAPRNVFGVRAGLGVTALSWTRTFFGQELLPDDRGVFGDTVRVFATLVMLPLALMNHAELTFEVFDASPYGVRAIGGFRVGAGF